MRRADEGKAAGAGAVSQLGPGSARRARRGRGASAAQPGLRVRGGTRSGGPGHLRSTRAAGRCEHGPGAGADRGCPCPGAPGPARGERRRRGDPCEGGRRQQPSVSASTSPERSGGLRGPNGGGGGSGYLLRGEASPGPGKVVERLGGGDARAPGAVLRLGAAVGGMGGRGTRCNALISPVPPRAFAPPGPERFGAKQMCVLGGRGGGCLPFFPVELSAFPQRGAVPGGEAEGQPRPSLPPARARCEPSGEAPLALSLVPFRQPTGSIHFPPAGPGTTTEPGANQYR